MGQLTIYIDDETERRIKTAAESSGLSLSRWVATVVREKTESSWPRAVLDLAGAWPDFPTAEELREAQGTDSPRESF